MEVRAFFGRFVWHGISIYDVTIHPSRGSIPHWRCANTTGPHTLQKIGIKNWKISTENVLDVWKHMLVWEHISYDEAHRIARKTLDNILKTC